MQHFEGTVIIKASRSEVWDFLMDPYKVGGCMPGVESVEVEDDSRKFRAVAAIGFGSVKARFKGEAEFIEIEEPNWATLKAHGNAPGSAMDVTSLMMLSDAPDGMIELKWSADITVLGTLASLASRLMALLQRTFLPSSLSVSRLRSKGKPALSKSSIRTPPALMHTEPPTVHLLARR